MTTRVIVALAAIATAGCRAEAVLTQQVEARRLASELQVQFAKAADASNRAVMTDADEDSTSAVREAERATQEVLRDVEQLRSVLTSMGYSEELGLLDGFTKRLADYRKLDAEILPLAVENSNAKAQRLSFGPAADAINEFRSALNAAVRTAPPGVASRAELIAARAVAAVRAPPAAFTAISLYSLNASRTVSSSSRSFMNCCAASLSGSANNISTRIRPNLASALAVSKRSTGDDL